MSELIITMTDAAQHRVKQQLTQRGKGLGVRFGTKVSGCTGFAYVVDFIDHITDDDIVIPFDHYTLVVPSKDADKLNGTEIDYVKESLLSEGFEFRNPNVKDLCGCGESFSV